MSSYPGSYPSTRTAAATAAEGLPRTRLNPWWRIVLAAVCGTCARSWFLWFGDLPSSWIDVGGMLPMTAPASGRRTPAAAVDRPVMEYAQ